MILTDSSYAKKITCIKYTFLAIALSIMTGCKNNAVSEMEFKAYINNPENGLIQKKEIEGTQVSLTFIPGEIFLQQELQNHSDWSSIAVDSIRTIYANRLCFALDLSKDNREIEASFINNRNAYNQVLQYLNREIGEQIKLIMPSDTLPVTGSVYPRMFNTTNHSRIILIFDTRKVKLDEDFKIEITDSQLGLGVVSFPFKMDNLKAIPSLKLLDEN
ncbi:hypothetical protein [Xanthocytophaga agilis]|uniref:Uncharacterized protein n=1 Tax=Xanthocytophaga agilis TaxID=3048010 RepID=A0AAE3R127_9BACT|nr:hypothetical protein [Xanthocytophaga agilis]MDJ1501170.1 hypothetical protein [Xanthocytophaga agilis]